MRSTELQDAQRVDQFFQKIPTDVRSSLSNAQTAEVKSALDKALEQSKPSPKIVDLRFVIDLFFARYYFVLFVGRDRRAKRRNPNPNVINRLGNVIAVGVLLVGLNLLVTSAILLSLYLTKSALGIDIFPGHMGKPAQEYIYLDSDATN